jgi:hypothetical protein
MTNCENFAKMLSELIGTSQPFPATTANKSHFSDGWPPTNSINSPRDRRAPRMLLSEHNPGGGRHPPPSLLTVTSDPERAECAQEAYALARGSLIPNDWQWSARRDIKSEEARSKAEVLSNSSVTGLISYPSSRVVHKRRRNTLRHGLEALYRFSPQCRARCSTQFACVSADPLFSSGPELAL